MRRAKQDQAASIARNNPREARMHTRDLRGNAWVILEIKRRDGSVWDWMKCELMTQPKDDGDVELAFQCRCPECDLIHGRGGTHIDMTIKQSNRMFWLDEKLKGQVWANPNDPRDVVVLAGTITMQDKLICPVCSAAWRIDNSVMRRD
jgi:hypothetical protein